MDVLNVNWVGKNIDDFIPRDDLSLDISLLEIWEIPVLLALLTHAFRLKNSSYLVGDYSCGGWWSTSEKS